MIRSDQPLETHGTLSGQFGEFALQIGSDLSDPLTNPFVSIYTSRGTLALAGNGVVGEGEPSAIDPPKRKSLMKLPQLAIGQQRELSACTAPFSFSPGE